MVLARDDFINRVRKAGIVGAGGAGFPTYFKLNNTFEYFIVNISECEPLLKVDQQIASFFADNIIKALDLIKEVLKPDHVCIAIKKKYTDAVDKLNKAIKDANSRIELFLLEDFYPAGDEFDIVYNITGRIIPEGGLPLDVGAVVDNVGTVLNIYNAVFNDEPVTSRWLTVSGAVKNPQTINLPLGTPVKEAIEICGGASVSDYLIIDGGPMMGLIIDDPDNYYILKTTTGLLVLPSDHELIKRKEETIENSIKHSRSVCEQCNLCTEFCSRYILGHKSLQPHLMMRRISYLNEFNLESYTEAYLCSECGTCSYYACPMLLSPKDIYKFLKTALEKNNIENPYIKNKDKNISSFKEYSFRRIPLKKLKYKLNVKMYDKEAQLSHNKFFVKKVNISLQQHIGQKSISVVEEKTMIKKGEIIAKRPEDSLGSNIHASISGYINRITEDHIEIEKK